MSVEPQQELRAILSAARQRSTAAVESAIEASRVALEQELQAWHQRHRPAPSTDEALPAQTPIQCVDVITHRDCLDGMASAWVVRECHLQRMQRNSESVVYDLYFHYADYDKPLPPIPAGSRVIMVDFCPNDPLELVPLIQDSSGFTLLDHHPKSEGVISALQKGFPGIDPWKFTGWFTKEKSGALMAWEYFMDKHPPAIIQAISDRDLWKFELMNTREICESLFVDGMTLKGFDRCMKDVSLEEHIQRGTVLLQAKEKQINWLIENTRCELMAQSGIDTDVVLLAVNGTHAIADSVCSALEERFPGYKGYVCYWDVGNGTRRQYSIRSEQGYARRIAVHYSGEGHEKAAGFTLLQRAFLKPVTKAADSQPVE